MIFLGRSIGAPGARETDGEPPPARVWILMSDWCGGPVTVNRNHDVENPDAA